MDGDVDMEPAERGAGWSFDRVRQLNLLQCHFINYLAKELGFPYEEARSRIPDDQLVALLATAPGSVQEEAEGVLCIRYLMFPNHLNHNPNQYQQEPTAALNFSTDDSPRVCRILRQLVSFEQDQIKIENCIFQSLGDINEKWVQLQNGTHQQMEMIVAIVQQLYNLEELINHRIINEWKRTNLYAKNWVWPICAIVRGWLKNIADVSRWLYWNHQNSGICRVLQNLFNDTFIPAEISARFIVYDPDQGRKSASVNFLHLLSEYFTVPLENQPVISIIAQNQVESSFALERDTSLDIPVENNIGEMDNHNPRGPDGLLVKFGNLKVGKPREKSTRNSGEQPGPSNPNKRRNNSTEKKSDTTARREKYWFLCELFVEFQFNGFTTSIKLSALTPSIVIAANTSQTMDFLPTIVYETAGFSTTRGHFVAPPVLPCAKFLTTFCHLMMAMIGRPLSELSKECLKSALESVAEGGHLSIDQFAPPQKHAGPEGKLRPFNFFYGLLHLGHKHFKPLLEHGLVIAWISRDHLKPILKKCAPGTILIRATISVEDAVTVSWLNGGGVVKSLEPLTKKDLQKVDLASRIKSITDFQFIYPNHPKSVLTTPMLASASQPPSPPPSTGEKVEPAPSKPSKPKPPRYVHVKQIFVLPSSDEESDSDGNEEFNEQF